MPNNTLLPSFNEQFFDIVNGVVVPAANYQLFTYISGTSTLKNTSSDQAGANLNTNPIILDSKGRCNLFALSGDYTLKLLTPVAAGSALVWTIDGVTPQPLASATAYLPLAGGTMTGPIVLAADATANLNPVSLQQLNVAITGATASVAASVLAATTAAAAATAAVAAITRTSFALPVAAGGSATRTVMLSAGTWYVFLETLAHIDDSVLGTGSVTVTQSATVGTTTVNTTLTLHRTGSAGYGRNNMGGNIGVGTLVVSAAASFSMTMNAASLGSATSDGSILRLELQ